MTDLQKKATNSMFHDLLHERAKMKSIDWIIQYLKNTATAEEVFATQTALEEETMKGSDKDALAKAQKQKKDTMSTSVVNVNTMPLTVLTNAMVRASMEVDPSGCLTKQVFLFIKKNVKGKQGYPNAVREMCCALAAMSSKDRPPSRFKSVAELILTQRILELGRCCLIVMPGKAGLAQGKKGIVDLSTGVPVFDTPDGGIYFVEYKTNSDGSETPQSVLHKPSGKVKETPYTDVTGETWHIEKPFSDWDAVLMCSNGQSLSLSSSSRTSSSRWAAAPW